MPYTIPDFAAIRQRMLRDAANLDPTAPQDRDSDHFARSSATASAVSGLYDFLSWQARQLLPDTAHPDGPGRCRGARRYAGQGRVRRAVSQHGRCDAVRSGGGRHGCRPL